MQRQHKSKTPKVYKNKKLNNANFGTYNLNDYQVFLQLISKIGKVDINGTYQQPHDLERQHTLTAKEFSQLFGVDLNTTYGVLKRASNKLARTAITLQKPELFEIWDIPICEFSKYNTKEGSLTVTFSTHIMPYLAQVKKKFVLYNLKEVANFGSLYSTRLYELIQEFKDTGYIIKSVAQLREVFAVGKKFPDYNNFKRKTFAHAVDEINAQYEMNLQFEELKEGRKVVSIRFEFTPSHKAQGYNPATKQMVNITVKPKRKTKQDDDNTPPSVHIDQQELELETPTKKSILKKVVDGGVKVTAKGIAKNPFNKPSVQNAVDNIAENGLDALNMATAKKYKKERLEEIAKSTPEEIKAIIDIFIKRGMSKTEALDKGIELELIIL